MRHHRIVLGAVALAALALAAACGGDDDEDLRSVTLMLNWTPNNHHAGIYAAREQGWYEEVGIDLQIVEPAGAGADAVVGSKGAEFGISQAESMLPARAAGVPVVSIATLLPHNDSSLMALGSEGITRPRDFEGKRYGGFGGTLEQELISALVSCDGGDPALVDFVEVGNIDYLVGLEQDRFDFVWIFEGWDALRARAIEGREIATVRFIDYLDCIPDWYTPLVIAHEDTVRDDPDLVRDFLAATARGYALASADPEEAARLLLEAAPELDEALVRASADYHAGRYTDGAPWGTQTAQVWARFGAFIVEAGLIDEEIDTAVAFTNGFLAP